MHAHTKTKTNKNMEQNIDDENGMYTKTIVEKGLGLWCLMPLSTIFQLS